MAARAHRLIETCMRLTPEQFRARDNKAITLLGMSGVGKTRISALLNRNQWFHYSGDYRIGTRYLDEAILDNIKLQAMQVPLLADLLRSDSIHIQNNISFNNLTPLSSFLGMLGDPQRGGLALEEFKRRQALHRSGEIAAMKDVPAFIERARRIYGYPNFINDAGGSLCELDDESVLETLAEHTIIIYIRATAEDEAALISRAEVRPKPMFYRADFLDTHLAQYMQAQAHEYVADVDPKAFVRWIFPILFRARVPRYEAIAKRYGYTISTRELAQVHSGEQLLGLIGQALAGNTGQRLSAG